MRIHYYLPIILLLFLTVTGCGVPSVYPLYHPQDLQYRPELSGQWTNENRSKIYNVFNLQDLKYDQVLRDTMGIAEFENLVALFQEENLDHVYLIGDADSTKNDAALYIAGLLSIEDELYLDLFKNPTVIDNFMYPVHIFVKLELKDGEVVMHQFKEDWFEKQIKAGNITIDHELSFGNLLLTAPTDELKKLVTTYTNNPNAFRKDTDTFYKIPNKK